MQIGCGVTRKAKRGRSYLYFWHYEDRGGGRRQVFTYAGPVASSEARDRLIRMVDAYFARATVQLRQAQARLVRKAVTAGP